MRRCWGGRPIYSSAHAAFRVFGSALDPLAVTLALKLPPDSTHRGGEPRVVRTKAGRVEERSPHRIGMWCMSSQQWVNSPRLEVHLKWLLGQVEPLATAVAALQTDGVEMDFFCFSAGTTSQPPALPGTIRTRAAALGIAIVIDHHGA